jgi:predicted transglutaminase-like cysteine proteinase
LHLLKDKVMLTFFTAPEIVRRTSSGAVAAHCAFAATICVILGVFAQGPVFAASVARPMTVEATVGRIQLDQHILAPMAYAVFCARYPSDCEISQTAFRNGAAPERWAELMTVNRRTNRAIAPERNVNGLAGEIWLLSPKAGDCNDYAVTKRHELVALGWPSRALLLAEVVTDRGEHHLILVVRTPEGDFVLDNMTATIRTWSTAPYRWVRMQWPENPKQWMTIRAAERS